jgi:type II secretory pathway component GspD/PulD (secretin)
MHRRCLAVFLCALIALTASAAGQEVPVPAPAVAPLASVTPSEPSRPAAESAIKTKKISSRDQRKAKIKFLEGAKAFEKGDLSRAEDNFFKAHVRDPDNAQYSLSIEIVRQYQVARFIHRASEAEMYGDKNKAMTALHEALRLDPHSPMASTYMNTLKTTSTAPAQDVQSHKAAAASPIKLDPQNIRCAFHLQLDKPDLIRQVLKAYGIEATIDNSVSSAIVHFDVQDVSFTDATDLVKLATATFFVPLDPQHVLAVSDTTENRNKYQRLAVETIDFPGLTPTESTDLQNIARTLFGLEHVVAQDKQGKVILRAPGYELQVINQAFAELLAGRNEVQLDIHVYEVDKTKETNAGATLPNSATLFNVRSEINNIIANNSSLVQQIISSGLASAGDYSAILAILLASGELSGTVFNNAFVLFGGGLTETGAEWNSATANMLLNSSDVRSVNQVQLRVQDQEEATFRDGERYPVMTSNYTAAAGSSSSSTITVPQIQYQDLGLTLKVKPVIEGENKMLLNLDLQLAALAGSTLNNIPVLSHQQYTGVVSLRTGESALVVSAMSKQDEREISGIPGLSELPGLRDTTNRDNTMNSKELVVLITPHIVRLTHPENAGTMYLLPM